MFNFIVSLFTKRIQQQSKVLGRWGYHWDQNVIYKKYYD